MRTTIIKDALTLKQFVAQPGYNCYFHVNGSEGSIVVKDMLLDLVNDNESIQFALFDSKSDDSVIQTTGLDLGLNEIPTVVLYLSGEEIARVEGPNCPHIVKMLREASMGRFKPSVDRIKEKTTEIAASAPIVLLMKGTKEAPYCGFSKALVNILKEADIEFGYFDIFSDQEVREAFKKVYEWPTYPMLLSNGQLVGGLDVIRDIIAEGGIEALKEEIEACAAGQ